jgi:hypothetical protein
MGKKVASLTSGMGNSMPHTATTAPGTQENQKLQKSLYQLTTRYAIFALAIKEYMASGILTIQASISLIMIIR